MSGADLQALPHSWTLRGFIGPEGPAARDRVFGVSEQMQKDRGSGNRRYTVTAGKQNGNYSSIEVRFENGSHSSHRCFSEPVRSGDHASSIGEPSKHSAE